MIKRMIIMLALVAIVVSGIYAFKAFGNKMMKQGIAASFTAPTVSTTRAEMQDWQQSLKAVGTLRAVNGTDLSAELAGIVQSIRFQSGDDVKAGAILVTLRADDEIARLHTLQANAKIAQVNYDRDVKQLAVQAVAQATVDNDQAALAAAKAQVAEQQAIVDKKTVRAPFDGHLGIRLVDNGQYLNPGTPIVTLQQLDPIYADFSLPEQSLARLTVGQHASLTVEGNDTVFGGQISAVNSRIDASTRNVQVRATFDNPDRRLIPGMFGSIDVGVGQPMPRLTLPQTAIVFNPYGNAVFVVQHKKDDKGQDQTVVQQEIVITGETRGDQIAITSGVSEGDEIVTSGQVKLRNGSAIVINNEHQPSNDAHPQPSDE